MKYSVHTQKTTGNIYVRNEKTHEVIATMGQGSDMSRQKRAELFAASPDMLEALKKSRVVISHAIGRPDGATFGAIGTLKKIDEAIAKAEGK